MKKFLLCLLAVFAFGDEGEISKKEQFLEDKSACDNDKIAFSCMNVADEYANGSEYAPKDEKLSFEYNSKACQYGFEPSCMDVAKMYFEGKGVAKNEQKAIEMYEEYCAAPSYMVNLLKFDIPQRSCDFLLEYYSQQVGANDGPVLQNACRWEIRGRGEDRPSCKELENRGERYHLALKAAFFAVDYAFADIDEREFYELFRDYRAKTDEIAEILGLRKAGVFEKISQNELDFLENILDKKDFESGDLKKSAKELDDELNALYKKIMKALDNEKKDKMRAAQRAWVKYKEQKIQIAKKYELKGAESLINAQEVEFLSLVFDKLKSIF